MLCDRLSFTLVLTLPIVYGSESFQAWFGFFAIDVLGVAWIVPMSATAVFVLRRSAIPEGRPATTSSRSLSPAIGALLMSSSTVIVAVNAVNAMTLRFVKLA